MGQLSARWDGQPGKGQGCGNTKGKKSHSCLTFGGVSNLAQTGRSLNFPIQARLPRDRQPLCRRINLLRNLPWLRGVTRLHPGPKQSLKALQPTKPFPSHSASKKERPPNGRRSSLRNPSVPIPNRQPQAAAALQRLDALHHQAGIRQIRQESNFHFWPGHSADHIHGGGNRTFLPAWQG